MFARISLVVTLLFAGAFLSAAEPVNDTSSKPQEKKQDGHIKKVLKKINSVDAYTVPDLKLQQDEKYAHTKNEVRPFRHVKPYKEHFLKQMEYTGPGRAKPDPENIESVKIGFIGPIMSTVSVATGGKSHEEPMGIKMLQGARLAIEQANADGGWGENNVPFELLVHNDNGLWGASGNEIIDMVYKEKVRAILGTIDGANSHIAIRVALKCEIVIMNSGDTDPTFIETNIPWVFRCIGDDRQQSYLLVDYLYKKRNFKRVGIIRSSNRYGRFGVREIRDGSRRLMRPVILEMAYALGQKDYSLQLERIKEAYVDAVVHWGDADEGAVILNQMREMGMNQPFFACDRCLSDRFVEIAGKNAEDVVCSSPWNPHRTDKTFLEFKKMFHKRFGEDPETYAVHGYDGMNMLIWAIRTAGLNRAKIRDVLSHRRESWPGASGKITLSAALDDIGDVYLAKRENGKWRYYSREELAIPDKVPVRQVLMNTETKTRDEEKS